MDPLHDPKLQALYICIHVCMCVNVCGHACITIYTQLHAVYVCEHSA